MMNLYSKVVKIDSHIDFIPSKNYSLKRYSNQTGYDFIDLLLKKNLKERFTTN